jgi:tRNA (guanine37-N1)-methyltransferase
MSKYLNVVTIFPGMFEALTAYGISGRAVAEGYIDLHLTDPRAYAPDAYRSVDDRPYGGGPGMVMSVAPLRNAIRAARRDAPLDSKVIYLSPQGRRLDQNGIKYLASLPGLILVAGRYEGIDERLVTGEIDEEWSIGDYVLSGGELAAMVVIDAITRIIPGTLGDGQSAEQDSFSEDGLLDCPHFTRPREIDGMKVPDILLTGDHNAIQRWRAKQALGRTWERRRDLIDEKRLTAEQQVLLREYLDEHIEK